MPNCTPEEDECKHTEVKYCRKCDMVYCLKCGKEWGINSVQITYYPIYPTYNPAPQSPIRPW